MGSLPKVENPIGSIIFEILSLDKQNYHTLYKRISKYLKGSKFYIRNGPSTLTRYQLSKVPGL